MSRDESPGRAETAGRDLVAVRVEAVREWLRPSFYADAEAFDLGFAGIAKLGSAPGSPLFERTSALRELGLTGFGEQPVFGAGARHELLGRRGLGRAEGRELGGALGGSP